MTEKTPIQEEFVDVEPKGPGAVLRQGREARGLTQQAVASALHLKLHIIAALESDDFDHLPEPIYVRGYLKNYARLLRLPAEPLIEQYLASAHNSKELPEFIPPPQEKKTNVGPQNKIVLPLVAAAVIGSIILVLVMDNESAQETIAVTPAVDTKSDTNIIQMDMGAPPANPGDTNQMPESGGKDTAVQSAAIATTQNVEIRQGVDLVLTYETESWTEIVDATGNRVLFGLMHPGDTRKVHGMAPFEVLLGNAQGVTIEYNNSPFDLKSRIRKDTAKFKLGKAEDN
ncbi:MAG: hypothetical protein A2V90_04730 [Gammaproteobacteria bacterium RBG_16_57_12]|nr:MAG: hypothetical protein A2V90_04730 [Gammaproteobacteria bacterium RBG_16_57_12]